MFNFTAKRFLPIISIFLAISIAIAPSANADIYSPDNSVKPDPLATSKLAGGQFHVGEFTGAAIYDYPITVPPGRNGMTPSVNLTYNSQDSSLDNIVGYRWGLNMYSISHQNKRGVEKLYSEPDFVANTPVGSGELVPTQLSNGHFGQYGQKVENNFSKYQYNDNGSWVVTDKQGTKYSFGLTDDAKQFDLSDPSRTYQWMLSEIRDRNGNFIQYSYFKADNQIYPKTIQYTGNGTETGIYEVKFLPFANNDPGAARPDSHFSYARGFLVETNHLLTGVEVYAKDVLRRQIEIQHATVDPIIKQTIGSITETGYSSDGTATSLSPATFEYTQSDVRWEESTDHLPKWPFEVCHYSCSGASSIYEWDMTGDGLVDFENYGDYMIGNGPVRSINDGKGGWQEAIAEYLPVTPSIGAAIPNIWRKAIDFDGDARADLISSSSDMNDHSKIMSLIKLNNGQAYTDTIAVDLLWGGYVQTDNGASVADLNGDGLPDIIQSHFHQGEHTPREKTCLNNEGKTCSETNLWESPEVIVGDTQHSQLRQTYIQDCNSDGLADVYYSGSGPRSWINDGKGGWVRGDGDARCQITQMDSNITRSADLNGDGLMDSIASYKTNTDWGYTLTNQVYLNKGDYKQTIENIFPILLGTLYNTWHQDSGVRIVDVNGDLLPDVIQSLVEVDEKTGFHTTTKKVYMNKGSRPYYLKTIHSSQGGQIDLEYKTSAQHLRDDGTQANPNLPFVITTLDKMTVHDGMGNSSSVSYLYEDGHYHYDSVYDRELAGFRAVTKTDSLGYKTKTYYHQGQHSIADTALGEFDDHISKKGMAYRSEAYDLSARLVKVSINKYDKSDLGGGRFHPYLSQTVAANYNPAKSTNQSIAKAFVYDAYGNPQAVTDFGEVQLNSSDGQFTDIGTDLLKQELNYTQNLNDYMVGLPSEQKLYDQSNNLLSHQRTYYDDLALSEVLLGNPTKSESWLSTTSGFISSSVEYNAYGMPIRSTNPRGYSSTVTYDSDHLYPTTQTNSLGHQITTSYDVATGNLLQGTDPNGALSKTTYDGLGRQVKSEITNPKTNLLITAGTVVYNDTAMPRSAQSTSYNDDNITIDSHTYLDGLGRTIEAKQEAANGQWITSGSAYDQRGNVTKTLQPYFSQASGFEAVDTNRTGTEFTYDALNRVLTATNPLGTTTNSYDIWSQKITDPNNNVKGYQYDARGRLAKVDEHLSGNIHQTTYDYDKVGNLTKMTDALNNIRQFTYDSLGRRLSQTDAHQPGQVHGLWSYEYDQNSNLTKRTDPLNQNITYTYDALDRATSEVGSDTFTLTYDQGQYSIGRVSQVTGSNYQHNFTYDLLGRVLTDAKVIDDQNFPFTYEYDLMGGVTKMVYPDATAIDYSYNSAHQLSKVSTTGKVYADQFTYTVLGQLSNMRLGEKVVVTNTHDPNQLYRLTSRVSTLNNVTDLQNLGYTYDPVGNLTQLVDASGSETAKTVGYQYDDLYRLTQAEYANTANASDITMTYQYDPIGNITNKSDVGAFEYSHHNPHAVTKAGQHVYGYDTNGNMVQRDGKVMQYDYRSQIIKSGDDTAYKYDEGNTRIKKYNITAGTSKYYPNKYFEKDSEKEVKYIFAGQTKIAKIVKTIQTDPGNGGGGGGTGGGGTGGGGGGTGGGGTGGGGGTPPPVVPPVVQPSGGSGGGGGYRTITTKPQIPENISDNSAIKREKIESGNLLKSQSGNRKNTPKSFWPEVKSDIEFENLQITYRANKAIIKWDKMDKSVVKFNIFRSRYPYPHRLYKDAGRKMATILPDHYKNIYTDKSIEISERYAYRVVAYNKENEIVTSSILLHPELIFITAKYGDKIDFSKVSDKKFNKIYLYKNELFEFAKTSNPLKIDIHPKYESMTGGNINARFIQCTPKTGGGESCKEVEQKNLDVYTIKRPKLPTRLRNLGASILRWII